MQSNALTVAEYLDELDNARRPQIQQLRELILKHLPAGFEETMAWGMICYQVPLEISGPTYNKQPLVYVGLASQKNHISVYLMPVYSSPELHQQFLDAWAASGHKLDMGKGCIRFKNVDQAALDAIATVVDSCTPQQFTQLYLSSKTSAK